MATPREYTQNARDRVLDSARTLGVFLNFGTVIEKKFDNAGNERLQHVNYGLSERAGMEKILRGRLDDDISYWLREATLEATTEPPPVVKA